MVKCIEVIVIYHQVATFFVTNITMGLNFFDYIKTTEHGVRWNEKWVYVDPKSGDTERVVLWHRYELQGVFTVMPDGSWVAEPIGTA